MRLVQDAQIWATRLDKDVEAVHPLAAGRRAWLQIVSGELMLGDEPLEAGDAAAITDANRVMLRATRPSEVLLFDMA